MFAPSVASKVAHDVRCGKICELVKTIFTGDSMKQQFALVVAALFVFLTTNLAFAQAPQIPISDMIKRPEYSNMSLSINGKRLAATVPSKGRENLIVIDLEKRTRSVITSFDTYDVVEFAWINNDRLIFRVGFTRTALTETQYKGTYAVDANGENLRDLSRLGSRSGSVSSTSSLSGIVPLSRITDDKDGEFIVEMNLRRRDALDVYRLNTNTGRSELLTFDSPAETGSFVLDGNLVPRIARAADLKANREQIWYRADAKSPWTILAEWDGVDPRADKIMPLRFEKDNKTLIVASSVGRDKAALYRYDPEQKKLLDMIFENPLIDVSGGLIWSQKDRRLLGVSYSAEKEQVKWLDPEMAKLQAQIDLTLPGYTNNITFNAGDESVALVRSYNERDSGRYQVFDRVKNSLEALPEVAPWRKPEYWGERSYYQYAARDGLNIPAWLSLPPKTEAKALPLIVHIHGGPYARSYGFTPSPDARFLSNRGYAVLEPEPRGSTGFGKSLHAGGIKQWGQKMQDDITDGILALVKAGIVDRNRVCLYGGSYGGYATLQGMVREPDLIKCGLATVAVSDIGLLQTEGESDSNSGRWNPDHFYDMMIGNLKSDAAMIEANSPARNANKMKGAVLMVMGAQDVRVPIRHADRMVSAMKSAGVKHELVVYSGEGHGFAKDENRSDLYARMEKFFGEHIGKAK
jgi:dipeptidyl aminopeptidase/acylaminoacyl peptidase